ncbi:MAG: nicotinamide riboside transporter PnuC [Muribaculaceae bacterium]|nr:nicotinamide riboside transporter PnuC [Muribaculaceae bacterium]
MNYLEIAGVALGLIYLWLEYRASAWLWVASIAMPAIYLKVYYDAGLYADLAISVYYIVASIYGLICWLMPRRRERTEVSHGGRPDSDRVPPEDKQAVEIRRTPRAQWLLLSATTLFLTMTIGWALATFTDSTVPWADGFTTALSIVALWMLARKYLEQWLVWMVVDVACVALYYYKGLPFTAGLYLLYAIIAVAGFRNWSRLTAGKVLN